MSAGSDGTILCKCFHGCTSAEIVAALGLQLSDLFPKKEKSPTFVSERKHIYADETGRPLARKTIKKLSDGNKKTLWERTENGTYKAGLNGLKLPLYHLPALLSDLQSTVFLVEGEKDVETMERMGFLATSSPNGAGAKLTPEHIETLRGRSVVILGDNDEPGRNHMTRTVNQLCGVASEVRVIQPEALLPGLEEHGDVSDVAAQIGEAETKQRVERLAKEAVPVTEDLVENSENEIELEKDGHGKIKATVDNFTRILKSDPKFQGLRFNELTRAPEQLIDGKAEKWCDVNDAEMRRYIEVTYHIHSDSKSKDALNIVCHKNNYHPIRELIDSLQWDGTSRIYDFLHTWAKCEDTPYTREVSRLIFAGGIHRLYEPGCKFDCMPVLIGTKQGEGKTTLVQWLALKDEFYAEITNITDEKGVEQLSGAWICEMGELLAMVRAQEKEAVKSYLTRTKDRYRTPYARYPEDRLRQCIFIGTTNNAQFLSDKTGNRRFFPVLVYSNAFDLYEHEDECRAYILQCWAEAKALYLKGALSAAENRNLLPEIREQQAAATEDDYRIGMIEAYLEGKTEVHCVELWQEALKNGTMDNPDKNERKEISLIMQGFPEWERQKGPKRFPVYGLQRYWKRVEKPKEEQLDFIEIF